MSREDHELIGQYVNTNKADLARFLEVPAMGHTFQHYENLSDAFHGKEAKFDPKVVRLLTDWLQEREQKHEPVK